MIDAYDYYSPELPKLEYRYCEVYNKPGWFCVYQNDYMPNWVFYTQDFNYARQLAEEWNTADRENLEKSRDKTIEQIIAMHRNNEFIKLPY